MSNWTERLKAELKRDWRRTGILVVLSLVGVVLLVRQLAGPPASAKARDFKAPSKKAAGGAVASSKVQPIGPAAMAAVGKSADKPAKVFRFTVDVAGMAMPRFDPFKARLEAFPPDPDAIKPQTPGVKVARPFDPESERQRRLAMEAIVRSEAQKLQLQSILITEPPQAMIGGDIYRAGQKVGPFLLTRIGANSVTLEKDGFEVMLKME